MIRPKRALLSTVVALATSMLLARTHPFGDAQLDSPHAAPILQHADVPAGVRATLEAKCADCHSMQSRPPFYVKFAPVSWLVERDIVEGRDAMNLSEWETYSQEEQESLRQKILHETRLHKMPLPQYRIIHTNSIVTESEVAAITQWVSASASKSAGLPAEALTEPDATRGKLVFQKRCTGCHSLDENREGPRLRGVFGRPSASVPDFDYSAALRRKHLQWDEVSLERWLADPDMLVPGTDMDFHVPKLQERADLIRFLQGLR